MNCLVRHCRFGSLEEREQVMLSYEPSELIKFHWNWRLTIQVDSACYRFHMFVSFSFLGSTESCAVLLKEKANHCCIRHCLMQQHQPNVDVWPRRDENEACCSNKCVFANIKIRSSACVQCQKETGLDVYGYNKVTSTVLSQACGSEVDRQFLSL